MGLSRAASENRKIVKFSPPMVYNIDGVQKLERCPYQNVKTCDYVCIRLDTIPALDRQTDGRTDRQW